MNLIHTSHLTSSQKRDTENLVRLCQEHDHISLTLPYEDETGYYLVYDKEQLLSVLSAFSLGNSMTECSAFTLPSARRQGYFSDLLAALDEDSEGEDILFAADESCQDTVSTLKALKASFWYREYLMEASLEHMYNEDSISRKLTFNPPPDPWQPRSGAYEICLGRQAVGSFLLDVREAEIYFYGFQINQEYRNQRLGTAAFELLLHCLSHPPEIPGLLRTAASNPPRTKRLLLQVSGDNKPALSLYEKAGLTVIQTLSYYLY